MTTKTTNRRRFKKPDLRTEPKAPVRRRATPKPKPPVEEKRSVEAILADISPLFEAAESVMQKDRQHNINLSYSNLSALSELKERFRILDLELNKVLLPPDDLYGDHSPLLIRERFGTPPGEDVTFARPGRCIVWLAYVPICVEWAGILEPSISLQAVDASLPWITSTGYLSSYASLFLADNNITQHVRRVVAALAVEKNFKLHDLEPRARERIGEALGEPDNAWILAVLRKGPVDPLALPPKFAAVQPSLFGARTL